MEEQRGSGDEMPSRAALQGAFDKACKRMSDAILQQAALVLRLDEMGVTLDFVDEKWLTALREVANGKLDPLDAIASDEALAAAATFNLWAGKHEIN
jgi:hypothetical protein